MASTDAIPVPRKNVAYRVVFPIYKNDGTLITGAAGLDSEISKDQGTSTDCTNEATEIATNSGTYYLDLTSTEMNADCVSLIVKTSSTGAVIPFFAFYPQETGDIKVDVTSYGGSAGTFSGGRPEVNTTHAAGTAWGSGAITAAAIASGAITDAKFDTTAGAFYAQGVIDQGTAQAATGTTLQLRSAAAFADSELVGATILITGGSAGVGQRRVITAYTGSTDTATVGTWDTTPTGTITYKIFATAPAASAGTVSANVTQWNGTNVATPDTAGYPKITIKSGTGTGELSLSSGTVTAGAISSGAITATAIASNAITAAKIATDAIGAAQLAADAVTEIQSGLSTLTAAGIRSAVGLASANLDTQLTAIDDFIDTEVAAIKTQTDKLQFGTSNFIKATVEAISDDPLSGSAGGPYTS